MIEKIAMDCLSDQLTIPVYPELPENAPDRLVLVEKTGSEDSDLLCRGRLILLSYAETLYAAAQLNEQVKEAMEGLIQLDGITAVQLVSDYNYTDIARKRYRYQAIFDITYYKEANYE